MVVEFIGVTRPLMHTVTITPFLTEEIIIDFTWSWAEDKKNEISPFFEMYF